MRYLTHCLVAALLGLGLLPAVSRAEFVPWKYNWTRSPEYVYSDAPGTGYIHLTDEPLRDAAGESDIVATNIKVFSTAPPRTPDTFTNKAYTLTLFLLDVESGLGNTLTFNGIFNGTISRFSANIDSEFVGDTTQELLLGSNLYTVTIGPYTPPGPPDATNSGAISAHAIVSVRTIAKAPEPSTLVLTSVSLSILGAGWWRRRRRSLTIRD
jgi:hypothetical protein